METEEYIMIRDSIEEILAYIRLNYPDIQIPFRRRTRLNIEKYSENNWSWGPIEEYEPQYVWIPYNIKIWETISTDLPKSKECINKLVHDKTFNYPPLTDENGNPQEITYIDAIYSCVYDCTLRGFLDNYLNSAKSFDFNEAILKEVYQYFVGLRTAKEITEYAFIPLHGFHMEEETLDISDNISIERITDQDIQYIYSFKDTFSFVQENKDSSLLAHLEFKLCGKYTYLRNVNLSDENAGFFKASSDLKRKLKTAIIALRLASESKFRPFSIFFRESPVSPFRFSNIYKIRFYHEDFEYYPYREIFVDKYRLTGAIKSNFLNIFHIFTNQELQEKITPLRIGLEKFNQSFSRLTWEDMILDFVTVLDSTLLYNETSNFYKLSVRCSLLISNKLGLNVFKFTQELASLRNEIIHNGLRIEDWFKHDNKRRIDNKDFSINEFIEHCKTLVRLVLTEYIFRIDIKHDIGTINSNMEEAYFISKSKNSN